jgi:hypothetical protein
MSKRQPAVRYYDPDEHGDDEWGTWFNGFICGLIAGAAVWLLANWLV